MCGLAGFSFKKGKASEGRRAILAATLARLNDERGNDSWGLCGLVDGGAIVARGLGDLGSKAYELVGFDTLFLHTRYATKGSVTAENSHPFEIGNIIGAHNGMIYNHEAMCDKYNRKFPVDSMHLIANLSEGKGISDLEGYGVLEWIEKDKPGSMYLSKLQNGELSIYYIGDLKDPDGIVWSSEEGHLLEALECAGFSNGGAYKIETGAVYLVQDGCLYKTDRPKLLLANRPKSKTVIPTWFEAWGEKKEAKDGKLGTEIDLTDWQAWNEYCQDYDDSEDDRHIRSLYGG